MSVKPLIRSSHNKVLGGVCGGIAETIHQEAWVIRLLFLLLTLLGGLSLITYIILYICIPECHNLESTRKKWVFGGAGSCREDSI